MKTNEPLASQERGVARWRARRLGALGFFVAAAVAVAITGGVGWRAVAAAAPQASSPELAQANRAYSDGRYEDAVAHARAALTAGASPTLCWRIIGAARCSLDDGPGAAEARAQADASGRKLIDYVCKRNDVRIPENEHDR